MTPPALRATSPASLGRESELPLERAGHPVAHGEEGEIDPLVGLELGIERADRLCIGVLVGEIGDRSTPQHVVDQYDPARAHELQAALVVGVVAVLVGVDEGEVELARETLRQQPVERLERGRDGELDAALDARLLPIAPRDAGPLLAHIAAPELAG